MLKSSFVKTKASKRDLPVYMSKCNDNFSFDEGKPEDIDSDPTETEESLTIIGEDSDDTATLIQGSGYEAFEIDHLPERNIERFDIDIANLIQIYECLADSSQVPLKPGVESFEVDVKGLVNFFEEVSTQLPERGIQQSNVNIRSLANFFEGIPTSSWISPERTVENFKVDIISLIGLFEEVVTSTQVLPVKHVEKFNVNIKSLEMFFERIPGDSIGIRAEREVETFEVNIKNMVEVFDELVVLTEILPERDIEGFGVDIKNLIRTGTNLPAIKESEDELDALVVSKDECDACSVFKDEPDTFVAPEVKVGTHAGDETEVPDASKDKPGAFPVLKYEPEAFPVSEDESYENSGSDLFSVSTILSAGMSSHATQNTSNDCYDDTYTVYESDEEDCLSQDASPAAVLSDLKNEIHSLCLTMKQASRAIEACNENKKFSNSRQLAEAERVLLIAGLKRDRSLGELRRIRYEEQPPKPQRRNGTRLLISELVFPLNTTEDHETKGWFVVTCSSPSVFYASPLLEIIPNTRYGILQYCSNNFVFDDLAPDFVIKVEVHQLQVSNIDVRRTSKLFCWMKQRAAARRRPTQKLYYKDQLCSEVVESKVLRTSFISCGNADVTMDRLVTKSFLLGGTTPGSALWGLGKFKASVTNPSLSQGYDGFLTIGNDTNGRIVWDRKWCRLEGSTLSFWDNPSEEGLNDPKLALHLRNYTSKDFTATVRRFYMRPRAFMLEVADSEKKVVFVQYLLAADSKEEFKTWMNRISSILSTWKDWNLVEDCLDF